jgi:hypothetical protein
LKGFARGRYGPQIKAPRNFFINTDGIGVVSVPSYQSLKDMLGLFEFDTNIAFYCKGEEHITLTCEILSDEEPGEIYKI